MIQRIARVSRVAERPCSLPLSCTARPPSGPASPPHSPSLPEEPEGRLTLPVGVDAATGPPCGVDGALGASNGRSTSLVANDSLHERVSQCELVGASGRGSRTVAQERKRESGDGPWSPSR